MKPKIRHFTCWKRKFRKETEFHNESDNNASKWSLVKTWTITQTLKIGQKAGIERLCLL